MQNLGFDVSGVTCGGCAGSVQRTLSKLDGMGLGYSAKARPAAHRELARA